MLRDTQNVSIGILEPGDLSGAVRRSPDSEVILFQKRVSLQRDTGFDEVLSRQCDVRDIPPNTVFDVGVCAGMMVTRSMIPLASNTTA